MDLRMPLGNFWLQLFKFLLIPSLWSHFFLRRLVAARRTDEPKELPCLKPLLLNLRSCNRANRGVFKAEESGQWINSWIHI